ncbi:DNA translocase FtsK [Geomobilimonas luticola]|uniref:DNA translocase FtsK 4TM domain-containing protein n=1 Tax=Geomobilimonas luticola TaxID=1114878 RepID=A0ABS5S8Q0_9BACT|nr:DNA translocase FtsK [Geomobilimonas luticola]MBT0651756.1 DNA translocase FtsK 4TM domain-containing protein [Geomobilimonas luticola]
MDEKADKKDKLKKEIQGMALGAAGLFVLISLLSYRTDDLSFNSFSSEARVRNFGGRLGAEMADLLLQTTGLAGYLVPGALLFLAYLFLRFKEVKWRGYKWFAYAGLLVSLSSLFAFNLEFTTLFGQRVPTGGAVGYQTVSLLKSFLGAPGALLLLLPMLAASIMILSRFSFVLFADWWLGALGARWARFWERRALNRELMEKEPKPAEAGAPVIKPLPVHVPAPPPLLKKEKKKDEEKVKPVQEAFEFVKSDGAYQTPPLSLLDTPPATEKRVDREALTMNARLLEKKLKDFGVDGEVVEICPGPVVTMYEFAPGPGVKVSRIAGLADDLSMALQALSIRIIAPIPGKGVVGIELPNRDREMVFLKEIFASEEFHRGKLKLPMALGKDVAGAPLVTDLARMPHLLVAGATGSGKSVSINTMILSLLYTATPRDVRIIMVDPKMLELSIYEGIPHLLLPVVTNPKKAALALRWAVEEMGRRYRLMADKSVRNIDSYNKALEREEKELADNKARETVVVDEVEEGADSDEAAIQAFLDRDEELEHGHLPYIVVIVDELADLMMVAGRELEESIARLAQMARAAGIHLILATQRPSVDVITGLIKANFPARISFQVSSKTDSRTILDCNGAEALLGAGDMLFLPPGTAKLMRSHGAFVSDAEVQRVVEFLKKQGKPVYDKSILEMKAGSEGGGDAEEELDERYDDAVALVAETRQASISMIQRRLRIGYNRAARIIEKMEQEGIVGPSDGTSKPREVFINKL